MSETRLAVIGAGLIGKRHAEYVAAAPEAALSAIVDPSPSGRELAETLGSKWFASFAELLAADRPDGVIIATPNRLHVENGLEAVRAGLPAIVEKPIADSIAGAQRLVEAAEQAAQLKKLRIRIGTLKRDLSAIRGKKDALHVQLEAAEKKIGAIAAEMRRLEDQMGKARKRLKALDEERVEQEMNLAAMRLVLARDLRTAYTAGRQEQVKLLLNQENPAAIGRIMVYHGYFTRARAERMQRLRASLQRLENIGESIIQEKQQPG